MRVHCTAMVGTAVLLIVLVTAPWSSSQATIVSADNEGRAINATQQLIHTLESETPQRIENVDDDYTAFIDIVLFSLLQPSAKLASSSTVPRLCNRL